MDPKTRNLRLPDGAITSLRLTTDQWATINQAARRRGMRWPEWARQIIQAHPGAPNRSALLRRAAVEDAFDAELVAEREEQLSRGRELPHPMLERRYWHLDHAATVAELEQATIEYRADFTSYEFIAGFRHDGGPFVMVRNKLEDAPSTLLLRDEEVPDDAQDDEIHDTLQD